MERQTDKRPVKHNLLDGGNKVARFLCDTRAFLLSTCHNALNLVWSHFRFLDCEE